VGVHDDMCSPCAEQYSRLTPSRSIVVGSPDEIYGNEGSLMKTSHYVVGSLLAAGLLFIAPACASTYGSRSDHGRDYRSDSQRRAFANGQSEGLKNGRSDAEKGHRFEYEQHDGYRDADKGYKRGDGDRDEYRESFRKGFMLGYNDAYRANERDLDRRSRRR
jgi:hypothetical protein